MQEWILTFNFPTWDFWRKLQNPSARPVLNICFSHTHDIRFPDQIQRRSWRSPTSRAAIPQVFAFTRFECLVPQGSVSNLAYLMLSPRTKSRSPWIWLVFSIIHYYLSRNSNYLSFSLDYSKKIPFNLYLQEVSKLARWNKKWCYKILKQSFIWTVNRPLHDGRGHDG